MNLPPDRSSDAGPVAPPRKPSSRHLLALLVAMTAIGPLSLNILVPAVPGLARQLASDEGTVQLTISLYLLGLAVAQLALGPLADRFGRRPVVLAGLALTAASSALAVFAGSVTSLIAMRVVQSLGASSGQVIGRAIIRDLYDRERSASMIGLVTTATVVAPMAAPLIGGLLDTAFGWPSIFIFVAIASFAVLLWSLRALPETQPAPARDAERRRYWRELGGLLLSRTFNGYVLCSALTSASFFAFLGGAPHVMVTQLGRTSAEYGLWFLINAVGYMAGNFTASRFSLRYGVDGMIKWGLFCQVFAACVAALLVVFFFHLGPAVIFFPQVFISYGNGVVLPNAIAGAISVRPQAAGTASGITGFVQMAIGAGAAQAAVWALADAKTALPMMLIMAAASVAGLLAYLILVPAGRTSSPAR
jgi:DHA1 family bicyclomycin/chloramphenicol resistance-like MFS transporter